jgi:ABC-type nitrate/sulfonate/bicarbonate transport system substrate-binding protein
MRADWVQAHPNATKALLKAVMEAQMWCEEPKNRAEVAEICARRRWISAPVEDIVDRLKGDFDYGTGRVEANSKFQMRYWKAAATTGTAPPTRRSGSRPSRAEGRATRGAPLPPSGSRSFTGHVTATTMSGI